jgi:hypothetical protein
MTNYDCINYVLANYFASSVGYSEEEAMNALAQDLNANAELRNGVKNEVRQAMDDSSYSWSEALSEYDVVSGKSEADARRYAQKLLAAAMS